MTTSRQKKTTYRNSSENVFLWDLEDVLNQVWEVLLPTYLPTFPDSPNPLSTDFSIPKQCSISIKFDKGVFWCFPWVISSIPPPQFPQFSNIEGFLWNLVCMLPSTLPWNFFWSFPQMHNWQRVFEIRKKWKTNLWNLDLGQKMQNHFFRNMSACAIRTFFRYGSLRIISPSLEIPVTIFFWWSSTFFVVCITFWLWLDLYNSRRSLIVYPVDVVSFSYKIFPTPLYLHTLIYMQWVGETWDYWRRALYNQKKRKGSFFNLFRIWLKK